jgi:hypothetical protein
MNNLNMKTRLMESDREERGWKLDSLRAGTGLCHCGSEIVGHIPLFTKSFIPVKTCVNRCF